MIKYHCDVCEREVNDVIGFTNYKVKVKQEWNLFWERGWENVVLCNDCKRSFYELWKRKEKATR